MINLEMINTIKDWGFDIEKEYHITKAHDGIIGIKDHKVNENEIFEIYESNEEYLTFSYIELMEKLERQCDYIGDCKIYTKYKIYHEDAMEIITFSDYLGDEFEKYLKDNGIQVYDYDNSDIEEFFEQYGIEVY